MARTGSVHHVSHDAAVAPPLSPETGTDPSPDEKLGIAEKLSSALDHALDHHLGPLDEAAALDRELKRLGLRKSER